jgi:hypothetical protein
MAVMMVILLRLPGVLKKSDHPVLPLSLSSSMAALTSAYSSWMNSSFSLPSPCQCFLVAVFVAKPTGGFWHEKDEEQDDDRADGL